MNDLQPNRDTGYDIGQSSESSQSSTSSSDAEKQWILMSWIYSILGILWDYLTFSWLIRRCIVDAQICELRNQSKEATTYSEWLTLQKEIDELLGLDQWRRQEQSNDYDWRKLAGQKREIEHCKAIGDVLNLCGLLRTHPVRNLYNILSARLYTKAHAGTKLLIENYVREVQRSVSDLAAMVGPQIGFTTQDKMELFHDTCHSFGKSALVLQGGSAFSMCHLGVVKALHLRDLLPQVVVGTATGSLVAALVCVHTDAELLGVLNGKAIDLTAFQRSRMRRRKLADDAPAGTKWLQAIQRRAARFLRTGHVFNIRVLEECAQANLGNITFEEAFAKTGRILNVTIALPNQVGIPQLLNYITAPHVLIWSAVVASTATSKTLYAPVQIYCKNETGSTEPYFAANASSWNPRPKTRNGSNSKERPAYRPPRYAALHEAPLKRIGELFNVNHFIVSQTRPYIAPFVRASQHYAGTDTWTNVFLRLASLELMHWLRQLNFLGLLPTFLCRLLMDEAIPQGNGPWGKISLTPDLTLRDLLALFDTPTVELLDEWIMRGERCVWPAVKELRVRCSIEIELEKAYEIVKRRKGDSVTMD